MKQLTLFDAPASRVEITDPFLLGYFSEYDEVEPRDYEAAGHWRHARSLAWNRCEHWWPTAKNYVRR